MEEVVLKAVRRDVIGKQVKALRREGKLPAVVYGHIAQPVAILLDLRETNRLLGRLSPSALVTLDLEGESHLALVREKQRDPLRGALIHLDFQAVSLMEKLRTGVSVQLVGEAPAVRDYNASLLIGAAELEVECLPGDLPERITVDVSGLREIGDAIYARNLELSDKVEILADPDTILVVVAAQEAEEVEEEVVEEIYEPEVIEHGKTEEEDF